MCPQSEYYNKNIEDGFVLFVETLGFRKALVEKICSRIDFTNNVQNIHTPFDLCHEMIEKLLEYTDLKNSHICVLNLEFIEVLCYDYGVPKKNIWFITDCEEKSKVLKHDRYKEVKVATGDYLLTELKGNMKFDVIVGNPPYNAPQETEGKRGGGDALWDKFVIKSFDMLADGGYLCLVHPMGWRSPIGRYVDVKKAILANNLLFLSVNDAEKGIKVFGAGTAYDHYVCQKGKYKGQTQIQDFSGNIATVNVSDWVFIPNGKFNEIFSLVTKEREEKCKMLHSYSAYESRKKWISERKTKNFKYPVVHSVSVEGKPLIIFSNTNENGFFGNPKVIFGRRTCGTFIDEKGEYACSQHTSAISDVVENLDGINKCFQSKEFIELMSFCNWNSTAADRYNKNMLALFRKDFWKSFV